MALDPSIFGMANRPTVALENPMDIQMKRLAMERAQQEMESNKMDVQAKRETLGRQSQTRQAVSKSGGDLTKAIKAAMDAGDWETADKMTTALKAQQQANATFQKTMREMDSTKRAQAHADMTEFVRVAQPLTQAKTPEEFQAGVKAAIQRFDPDGSKGWAQMAPSLTPETLKQLTNATMEHKTWLEREFPKVTGWHEGVDINTNKPAVFGLQNGQPVKYEGVKPAPKQAMSAHGGSAPSTDPSVDPSKRSSRAEQIANGEIPVPKPTRGDPHALRDVADARQIMIERGLDPQDLPGLYGSKKVGQESFAAGRPNARIITAINTASDHTEKILKPAASALKNGDWQTANKLGNAIGVNLGKNEATNFDAVATFLATEVAKVASGGGQPTLSEIAEARKMFPVNGSNAQIGGAIDIANKIMGGKLTALDLEHKNAFNGQSIADKKRLSPEAIKNVAQAHGEDKPSRTLSLADAKATAKASGKTLEEVIKQAKSRGWEVK